MSLLKGKLFLISVAITVSALTTVVTLHGRGRTQDAKAPDVRQRKEEQESQVPTVDFDAADPSDPQLRALRRKKSARYDNNHFVNKNDASGGATESVFFDEWDSGLPALPAAQSDAVVVGEVTDAQAHLSNDKTGIYSEFKTIIEEVFKNPVSTLTGGNPVYLERKGGAVRYPSGRRYLYRISGQGMPRVGRRYVFFLRATEVAQTFRIITAYELRGSKVFPLDSAEQFDALTGVEELKFLNRLREDIGRPGGEVR